MYFNSNNLLKIELVKHLTLIQVGFLGVPFEVEL